jgi:hypothetical protein
MSNRLMPAAILAALVATGGIASAELSKKVTSTFKGQLIVSTEELPEGKNDKETIAKIKAAKVTTLTGEAQDDVTQWSFHYAAFLSKTGSTDLKLEFYKGDQLAADKRLSGVDPKTPVLIGQISINEDEGLAKGNTYTIKVVNERDQAVSTAQVTFK